MTRSPAVMIGTLVLGLACVIGVSSCSSAAPSAPDPTSSSSALKWGVFVPDDNSASSDLDVVSGMAGSEPDYVLRFAAVGEAVPIDRLEAISVAGAMPILSLEPWDPAAGTVQPAWSLDTITAGDHDADFTRWASRLASWNRPVMLRFAHEMNGSWYPWAVGVDGNTASDYIAAWKHVHAIFAAAGASRVKFMWAPNVPDSNTTPIDELYPGASSVDVLAIDGYNAENANGTGWRDPKQLFGKGLDQLTALGSQPIIVAETASAEGTSTADDKASWITELVAELAARPRVQGFVWFQYDKEHDWRLNSSAAAQAAFKEALAHRRR